VRYHSGSPHKFSEVDIKGMPGFLVDNIVFGDQVQSVGIPMGTSCAHLLADLIYIHMKQICQEIVTE
jgi:hypothetical protein